MVPPTNLNHYYPIMQIKIMVIKAFAFFEAKTKKVR